MFNYLNFRNSQSQTFIEAFKIIEKLLNECWMAEL